MTSAKANKRYIKIYTVIIIAGIFLLPIFSFGFMQSVATASAAQIEQKVFDPSEDTAEGFAFGGGDGSQAQPFLIATAAHLDNVRNYSLNYNEALQSLMPSNSFKMVCDIDLTQYLSENGAGYNNGKGWQPIEIAVGTFDGGGFTISGLWCDRPGETYVGLFGYAVNVIIKDLKVSLDKKGITGLDSCGGIAGYLTTAVWDKSAIVSGCSVTGNIYAKRKLSAVDGKPTAAYAGLIVGKAEYAKIDNCFAEGEVTGLSAIGGITGSAIYSDITDCLYKGAVIPQAPDDWEVVSAGGIAGIAYGDSTLKNCFYYGNGAKDTRIAAIAGFNGLISVYGKPTAVSPPSIYNCYYNVDGFNNPLHFIELPGDGDESQNQSAVFILKNSKGFTDNEIQDKSNFADWDFETVWGFDRGGNLVLRAFGKAYNPPPPANLTWLWITTGCALFGAAVLTLGVILYRRKKTEIVTVTNTVTEVVEKEIIVEIPIIKKPLPKDLTEQERRVAELILKGKSRSKIASAMGLSDGAVGAYSARIYIKAGVDNQKEFIAYFTSDN